MNTHEKFLNFNGKNIYFKDVDGEFWIAIKPICEVLNVDYIRAYKNISKDSFLFQLLSEQTMVGADNKSRKMVCLPERYIYGWIFSLRSKSEELKNYKITCYNVLFNHFNGAIFGRKRILQKQANTNYKLAKLQKELMKNNQFVEFLTLKSEKEKLTKQLKNIDLQILEENTQLNLF